MIKHESNEELNLENNFKKSQNKRDKNFRSKIKEYDHDNFFV